MKKIEINRTPELIAQSKTVCGKGGYGPVQLVDLINACGNENIQIAEIEVNNWDSDDEFYSLEIFWSRLETEQEMSDRIKREEEAVEKNKKSKELIKQQELAELDRLTKKYKGKI